MRARLEETTLRAPIDGIVLTPRLQERAGELLEVGGVFCTLADTSRLRVEIAVQEHDADVLVGGVPGDGLLAALKFNAFPEREVEQPAGVQDGLRPGMTGRARVDAGPRPIVSILLRRPYRFFRSLIWL